MKAAPVLDCVSSMGTNECLHHVQVSFPWELILPSLAMSFHLEVAALACQEPWKHFPPAGILQLHTHPTQQQDWGHYLIFVLCDPHDTEHKNYLS